MIRKKKTQYKQTIFQIIFEYFYFVFLIVMLNFNFF